MSEGGIDTQPDRGFAATSARTRVEWRSARRYAGEAVIMRFSKEMPSQSFIHAASTGIDPDDTRTFAANDQHGRLAAGFH